jgi:lambda repressor-like predicted transcriptional regulator
MDNEARQYYLRELRREWPAGGSLERAGAVVRLRNEGYSLRTLAKVAGCSEGTIRNYEILGRVPPAAKQFLYDGLVSMRRLVKAARKAQKPQA